jgi:hypothetical protein
MRLLKELILLLILLVFLDIYVNAKETSNVNNKNTKNDLYIYIFI